MENKLVIEKLDNYIKHKKNSDISYYEFLIALNLDNTISIKDNKNDTFLNLPDEVLFDLIQTFTNHLKNKFYNGK